MPTNPATNGRDAKGKFAVGNRAGRGNPLNRRVHKLRYALLRHVKKEDLLEVVDALLAKAKEGDLPSIRELLNRRIGRPTLPVEVTGADGEKLAAGPSLGDIQLTVIQALVSFPQARQAVADALHRLTHANGNGNGHQEPDRGARSGGDGAGN
jgi:hypothetical protein